jgi:hypothetical protein
LDQRGLIAESPLKHLILNIFIKSAINLRAFTMNHRYQKGSIDIRRTQLDVLRQILSENETTDFGQEHNFAIISDDSSFKANVSIKNYEDLRPYIMKQELQNLPSLIANEVDFYAITSGTTGESKLIPITEKDIRRYREMQNYWLYFTLKDCPGIFDGHILSVVGNANEGQLPSGRSFGSTSGHISRSLPRLIRSLYVLPPEVLSLKDHELKYKLILRLAVADPNITFLSSANPSTFNLLQRLANAHAATLIDEIDKGTFSGFTNLPKEIQDTVKVKLVAKPERAAI